MNSIIGCQEEEEEEELDVKDLHGSISNYSAFLQRVISDRQAAEQILKGYQDDVKAFDKLEEDLMRLMTKGANEEELLHVPLGAGVSMQAQISDPTTVFVSVGLGFHVECKVGEEANRVIEIRRGYFQAKAEQAMAAVERITTHERLVSEGLAQLKKMMI